MEEVIVPTNDQIQESPSASEGQLDPSSDASDLPIPVPSTVFIPPTFKPTSLTPVVCDDRVIARLLEMIMLRAGLRLVDVAHLLDVSPQTIHQYLAGRRARPSLKWFVKFVEVCGGRVALEMPERSYGRR